MNFFERLARVCLRQLPLFIMLVMYSAGPTYFYGWYSPKTLIAFVLPQTVLPSLLLCLLADRRRWLWWVVFVFANLLWLIEMGFLYCQHQRLWTWLALVVAQSNPAESSEYLSSVTGEITGAALTSLACAAAFYLLDRLWRRRRQGVAARLTATSGRRLATRCVGLLLALSVIYSPVTIYVIADKDKDYNSRLMNFVQANSACSWIMYGYVVNDVFFNPDMRKIPRLREAITTATVTCDAPADSLTVVYVVGESFSRNRSSLYGYSLDTNPLMAKEVADSAMVVFDNVISNCQHTYGVYRYMLSTYDLQGDAPFESYPLLPALMKKAGYRSVYLDNQKAIAGNEADWTCSYFLKDEGVRDLSIDRYNTTEEVYDGDFVAGNRTVDADAARSFTIYHLMGQHKLFDKRYPAGFARFTKDDYRHYEGLSDKGAEVMAQFDNATLYNDYVMHAIIDSLRDKTAILVYAPDHGEEVYDYREVWGRMVETPLTSFRLYYEVPAMIWMSDSFRRKYPDIVAALRKNTHKAIYNSDLPHTILDIAGIRTASFNPGVSLIRDGKGRSHRHVWMGDTDYDDNREEVYRQKLRYEK